jgi:hypothetical protein
LSDEGRRLVGGAAFDGYKGRYEEIFLEGKRITQEFLMRKSEILSFFDSSFPLLSVLLKYYITNYLLISTYFFQSVKICCSDAILTRFLHKMRLFELFLQANENAGVFSRIF